MKRRLYLAHPISGMSEVFLAHVRNACEELRRSGYIVYCPAEQNVLGGFDDEIAPRGSTHQRYLVAADVQWICLFADAIALYDGWEKSLGALAEKALAEAIGIESLPYRTWIYRAREESRL